MTEVEELVVAMRGEGLDETTDQLDQADQSMQDAGENMGESADEMEGFASRWEGAMTAIIGGLAIASAGLLAQVPVIGELMAGLGSIISAIAFQMDQVLRPVLQPITDAFIGVADAIFEAEGPLGTVVGILGTLAAAGGIALGSLALLGGTAQLASTGITALSNGAAVARSAVSTIGTAASVAVSGLTRLVAGARAATATLLQTAAAATTTQLALLGLVAVVAALALAFATDFMGIRSGTVSALQGASDAIGSFTSTVVSEFGSLIGQAFGWGVDLMTEFADGIVSAFDAPVEAAREALSGVADLISFDMRENDRMAQRWGEDMLTHFSMGMERGVQREIPDQGVDADGGRGQPATRGDRVSVILDGKRVDKGTRRFSADETAPRGRHS